MVHPQIQQSASSTMPGLSLEDRGGRRRFSMEVESRRDWNVDAILLFENERKDRRRSEVN